MRIEVMGPGCHKCEDTFEKVKQALDQLKIKAELVKVADVFQIIDGGVTFTPALIIDGKIVLQGRVPSLEQIREILKVHASSEQKPE